MGVARSGSPSLPVRSWKRSLAILGKMLPSGNIDGNPLSHPDAPGNRNLSYCPAQETIEVDPSFMRIADLKKGNGPEVSPKFHRGDSFIALDGEHSKGDCANSRQTIVGVGASLWTTPQQEQRHSDAVILRCSACLTSYLLRNN